jgi:uncharacterized protein (DUF2267 family)
MTASAANKLNDAVDVARDDDGHVPLIKAAGIIKVHKNWNDNAARRAIVGAFAAQILKAFAGRTWHSVHGHGLSPDDDGLIEARFWSALHANHSSVVDGRIPTCDMMDWRTGDMRVWRNIAVGELPNDAANLVSGLHRYDVVDWEYCCQQITVDGQDLIRIAKDRKLVRYGKWLDEQTPGRRGPAPKNAWDKTKAVLIVDAMHRKPDLKAALRNEAGLRAYIVDRYANLHSNGDSPDNRDLDRFVKQIMAAMEAELTQIPPS